MAKLENLTETLVKAQSIDFAEVFGKKMTTLQQMLGIERKLPMPVGSVIKTYKSKVTLQDGNVDKGDLIPLSKVEMEEAEPIELAFNKHRKAVSAEDIQKFGFERAVSMTDAELVKELQKDIRTRFFTQLDTAKGKTKGTGLKGAIAQGWGSVQTIFEDDGVNTIVFVNPLDCADYLASANITIQKEFGLNYVQSFLGADIAIITTSVKKGTLYATASDNLCLAYAQVSGGEINKAFDFVTDSTGVIGVTKDVNIQRLTAETVTLSAIALFAERLDGVIKVTIEAPKASTANPAA
jgi:hypothetical protein